MYVGESLKQARIREKITIDFISKELNISKGYIQAIENNEFSKTPGGVYTIGFIRTYANYLNLDSDTIINQYRDQLSLNKKPIPIKLPQPVEVFNFLPYSKIASFLIFVSVSVAFYFFFIDNSNLQPEFAITSTVPEVLESTVEKYEVDMALAAIKKNNNEFINKNNEINETEILKNSNILVTSNQISAFALKPKDDFDIDVNDSITLKALNSTWIQLRDINNEIVYSKLMLEGEIYNYSIKDNLIITTGNAGDLIVSIGNRVMGKLGKKGEVLDSISISEDYFSN